MQTTRISDDAPSASARQAAGMKTRLGAIVRLSRQAELRRLRGRLSWEGDLDDPIQADE